MCVCVCQLCERWCATHLRHRVQWSKAKQHLVPPECALHHRHPHAAQQMGTQPSGENLCEDLMARHMLSTKRKNEKMKTEKVKVNFSNEHQILPLHVFPYLLLFFSYFSSLPPPLWVKTCVKQRSRLQSVCQNILEAGQSVCGWLHLAIACHNAPPAVHHTRPKTNKKTPHRDVRVCVGGWNLKSPTLRWKTA